MTRPTRPTFASSASMSFWLGWSRQEMTILRRSAFVKRPAV
jgi:hypothetical protein